MQAEAPPLTSEPPALLKTYKWRTTTPAGDPEKLGGSPGSRRWARLQGWKRSYSHPDTEGDKGGDRSVAKATARRSLFQRAFSAPSRAPKGAPGGHEGTRPPLQRYLRSVGRRRGHGDTGGRAEAGGHEGTGPPLGTSPLPLVAPTSPDVTVWDVSQFSLVDGHLVPLGRDQEGRTRAGSATSEGVTRSPENETPPPSAQLGHVKGLLWKRLLRDKKSRGGTKSDAVVAVPEGDRVPSRSGSRESLVPPPELDLTGDNVIIRPVHGSVVGDRFCFQVITAQGTRSFGCSSVAERDRWMEDLRRAAWPDR
ncbi:RAS protein activator like-3-like, partial [Sylvia atricapilla]|uniref:RAS protein activator like-3-like n=1 Tax=Sylvia atricapilla TaxID=48155 RepID=UPI003394CAEA